VKLDKNILYFVILEIELNRITGGKLFRPRSAKTELSLDLPVNINPRTIARALELGIIRMR